MPQHKLYRVGLIAAIISTASWFVFAFGQLNLPNISDIADPRLWLQTIEDNRHYYLLYGWGGVLGTLLAVPYAVAFYQAMKAAEPLLLLALIAI